MRLCCCCQRSMVREHSTSFTLNLPPSHTRNHLFDQRCKFSGGGNRDSASCFRAWAVAWFSLSVAVASANIFALRSSASRSCPSSSLMCFFAWASRCPARHSARPTHRQGTSGQSTGHSLSITSTASPKAASCESLHSSARDKARASFGNAPREGSHKPTRRKQLCPVSPSAEAWAVRCAKSFNLVVRRVLSRSTLVLSRTSTASR
mmetsp:Transcript_41318/g.109431  ORF Transcript_41318/g.109431 Transcript_41318/m.109431 type:complete len:206 (-) Transcript_41318:1526-2143(-)